MKLEKILSNLNSFEKNSPLPPDSSNAPNPKLPLQEHIDLLEEENKLLKTMVETLMAVVGK